PCASLVSHGQVTTGSTDSGAGCPMGSSGPTLGAATASTPTALREADGSRRNRFMPTTVRQSDTTTATATPATGRVRRSITGTEFRSSSVRPRSAIRLAETSTLPSYDPTALL